MTESQERPTRRDAGRSDPSSRLIARLSAPIPCPEAPRGKEGLLALSISLIALGSIAGILVFFYVLSGDVLEYSMAFVYYYSMTFVLGCYGLVCVVFLVQHRFFAVPMTLILLCLKAHHNFMFWRIKPGIVFTKHVAAMSAAMLVYFLISKRVRNTYLWRRGDDREQR